MDLTNLVSDIDAIHYNAERAKSSYLQGTFDPSQFDAILDASAAAKTNAHALISQPAGDPVPDGPTTARTQDAARQEADAAAQTEAATAEAEKQKG